MLNSPFALIVYARLLLFIACVRFDVGVHDILRLIFFLKYCLLSSYLYSTYISWSKTYIENLESS